MTQNIAVLDDEEFGVRTPEGFHRAPCEYQKPPIGQIMINAEGWLSGGDRTLLFLPMRS